MNKPRGMSQLDYLWTNYGNAALSNELSNVPSENIILTESAIVNYVKDLVAKYNQGLSIDSVDYDDKTICIRIKDFEGTIIDKVCIDKGSQITKFEKFITTQEDIDKGYANEVGNLCLILQDSIGQKYFIELPKIEYGGQETDSIITAVGNGKVSSSLKINNPILERSVDIKITSDGVRADLIIDNETNSAITLQKSENGISCHYKWENEENEIKFKALTSSEYYLLKTIDYGTLYFLTDLPCIYFRKTKYASSSEVLNDYITESEARELFNQYNQELIDDVKDLNTQLTDATSRINQVESELTSLDQQINNSLEWQSI